ncbi:MAG: glycosyltransferase [Boseongicola sp. SB0676_bin_33]|uniref:Glycosyltransferase n=1 Tax=Boseongicola sp. SB0664_bin_43 TaxID=2604844 RepID=A0A6B0Y0G8_9RHOB|nr:glycosyltransferase [Boseongicola sp. SB0664_bin_43]MYF88323.1 glycosyltransferase [Boseongicola sp. SB0676_bin_33]MYK31441.1 glycosyltransferase [Boseongicola sp. SB0670_bin_30]
MPAPIAVIIPTLNVAHALPATTEALLGGLTDGLVAELVLSDGGSKDGIADVARELGATLVTGPRGRGGQIARGIAAARAPWLLILHADTHLKHDWAQAAGRHMERHPHMAGWFRLGFRANGFAPRLVAGGANLRSRLLGLPFGDQGLLVARATLEEVGGVPDIPLMEDVALARRLKGRLRPISSFALTSAERYETEGWMKRSIGNLGMLMRYRLGASPEDLAARYERQDQRQ